MLGVESEASRKRATLPFQRLRQEEVKLVTGHVAGSSLYSIRLGAIVALTVAVRVT